MTPRRAGRAALAAVCAFALALPAGATPEPLELKVKAAFLYNFARLASWAPGKFARADGPLQVCVLDDDPVRPSLEEALAGKVIDGHALEVRAAADTGDWQRCHIAYLGAPRAEVLSDLAAHGVLTVYEGPSALPGGVIRLYLGERKLRFEVNEAAAERARLRLSSRLLALATVVRVGDE